MPLKIGVITDIHLGPPAWFKGQLRKITHQALPLTHQFVRAMNDSFQPDLVFNLGDAVQDTDDDQDLANYHAVFDALDALHAPCYPAAGNHDLIRLRPPQLLERWRRYPHLQQLTTLQAGHLYYTFQAHGWDFIVLHSHERTMRYIWLDLAQLQWLQRTLQRIDGPAIVLLHHSLADQDTKENHWFRDHPHLALIRERHAARTLLEQSGKVRAVLNGHLHWNNLTVHNNIPYLTLQSPIENMTGDERPCGAWSTVLLDTDRIEVQVGGLDPAHHVFHLTSP